MSDEDKELRAHFASLSPSEVQIARMLQKTKRARGSEPLPTLTEEWISLLRVRPIVHTAMTFSAAASLLLGLPAVSLLHALYKLVHP